MRLMQSTLFSCIALCTMITSLLSVFQGEWLIALAGLLAGTFWTVGELLHFRKSSVFGFLSFCALCIVLVLRGFPVLFVALVISFSVDAFDLSLFIYRMKQLRHESVPHGIIRTHLLNLLLANTAAITLVVTAVYVKTTIGLYASLSIGLVIIFFLNLIIKMIHTKDENS